MLQVMQDKSRSKSKISFVTPHTHIPTLNKQINCVKHSLGIIFILYIIVTNTYTWHKTVSINLV